MQQQTKTILAIPGSKKISVPRIFKRAIQVVASVALTCAVALAFVVGNGLLIGRGSSIQAIDAWLAFVKRSDILSTMVLTALVTVLFVYWQRDQERR